MQRLMMYLVLITALFIVASCSLTPEDELFNIFENPPSEAKPFVRWWWGENSVAEKEILREIEVMDKAGIGDSEFKLADLGESKKKELKTFAGVITYRKIIQVKDITRAGGLDLGMVCGVSEVTFNGEPVGVRWYGQHLYDISSAVKPGENELMIKVTTVLHNHARTLDKKTSAGYWASHNKDAVSAGLIGPVKIR